ncbi:MAG: helix-turn-helix transcriptional regulator [Actinobacteria bacterium]|nr:helix-turn-helix transcriptional regulator [Actinomycetota bacterium]
MKAVDSKRLAILIKSKRQESGLTLQDLSAKIKISPATLSRLEAKETQPDTLALAKLSVWLNVPIAELLQIKTPTEQKGTTPDIVGAHLRADRNLSADAAENLAKLFSDLYVTLKKDT